MFPSDENQHRAKRPNLFSSSNRGGAADDNILARLERGAPNAVPGERSTRTRQAVLGFSGLLIAGLIGVLIILAQDNRAAPAPMEVVASVVTTPLPPDPQARPGLDPAAAGTQAVIVDQAEEIAPLVTVAPVQAMAVAVGDTPRLAAAALPAPPRAVRVATSSGPVDKPRAKLAARVAPNPAALARQAPGKSARKTARPAPPPGEPAADIDVTILAAMLTRTPHHAGQAGGSEDEARKPR